MIDVHGGEPEPETRSEACKRIEQHDGIDAAAQTHDDAVPLAYHTGETGGNAIGEIRAGSATSFRLP